MKAELISIGDELLIGQVVNTNASWMAVELNKIGIRVVQITAISDTREAITKTLDEASGRADVILMTGGLGPTKDDITKHVLAEYFDSELIFHEPSFQQIKDLFHVRNYQISEVNKRQADIPDKCIPLFNAHGTAPGMWFEKEGKIYVSMPGVPYEMKSLITDHVIPRLQEYFHLGTIFHKTIMTFGMGESRVAEKIASVEDSLPDHIKLAYLPQPGIVRLRLSATGSDEQVLKKEVRHYCNEIVATIPELVFGYDDTTMEEVVGGLLKSNSNTLATAESCTGGYLAHLVTSIAGSSAYFKGSVISYSNEIKVNELGVNAADIDSYGAVSQQVVEQMAIGGREKMNADYCLSTSGIAGPDGGTEEKPVGTVWIALAGKEGVQSKLLHLGEHRFRNIRRSALSALNMLRLELSSSQQ